MTPALPPPVTDGPGAARLHRLLSPPPPPPPRILFSLSFSVCVGKNNWIYCPEVSSGSGVSVSGSRVPRGAWSCSGFLLQESFPYHRVLVLLRVLVA